LISIKVTIDNDARRFAHRHSSRLGVLGVEFDAAIHPAQRSPIFCSPSISRTDGHHVAENQATDLYSQCSSRLETVSGACNTRYGAVGAAIF
jgi:hypothetical protein